MAKYDDARFYTPGYITLYDDDTMTTAACHGCEIGNFKVMHPCSVQDFNVYMIDGFTATAGATGTAAADCKVLLYYSLAGTGTDTAIGTATLTSLSDKTRADGEFADGSVTEQAFASGDHITAKFAGTPLPNNEVAKCVVHVKYVEDFTG